MIESKLTQAEPADLTQIAKDVYDLWSAGLTKDFHRLLFWSACYQPWSKRNHYRLVAKDKDKVAVSCKIVRLALAWRGKHFDILGLGAIFTAPAYRGQGLASNLVNSIVNKGKREGIDGLLLFSDIDRRFYGDCGFVNLGNLDFEIDNSFYSTTKQLFCEDRQIDVANNDIENRNVQALALQEPNFRFSSFSPWLENDEITAILGCYSRWLSKQPYGIVRTHNYFTFQLARHLFIATYSKNVRPKPCISLLKHKRAIIGYAITECGTKSLRILEVIGNDAARAELWHNLIEQAQQAGLERSSGFESVSRDFVPCQRLEDEKLALTPPIKASHISCYERSWGQPMFLSLNNALDKLPDYNPCPLLEFDYF